MTDEKTMSKVEVMDTWFQRVWSKQDPTAIDEMFPADGVAKGLGGRPLEGPEAFKQFQAAFCNIVCGIEIKIDKVVEDDIWAAFFCTVSGKSIASGKELSMTGSVLARIEGGVILEAYNQFDFMSLWEQLEYLPVDCFGQGLQGKKIA